MESSKESSVLFSLRELLQLEEQRRADEVAEIARHAEREAESARAAERRAHEEEAARRREEEAHARADAQERREEVARLAALHEAALERARREVEGATRMEELRLRQEHERQLESLERPGPDRRRVRLLAACSGLVVVAGAAWSTTLLHRAESAELALAAARQALAERGDAVDRAERALVLAQDRRAPALEAAIIAPLSTRAESAEPPRPTARPSSTSKATRPPKRPSPQVTSGPCPDWDPICGALP